jgi:GDP-mannose 4,6 dehydratase
VRKVLINGNPGTNGGWLAELLVKKGYEVPRLIRRSSSLKTCRTDHVYRNRRLPGDRLLIEKLADREQVAGAGPALSLHGTSSVEAGAAPSYGLRCGRCGPQNLRRSHSRSRPQKLVRRTTIWDRYACGHRGWIRGPLPAWVTARAPSAATGAAGHPAPANGGRRLERRDHRLRRRLRLRGPVAMGAVLLLGALVALFLQRCGAAAAW